MSKLAVLFALCATSAVTETEGAGFDARAPLSVEKIAFSYDRPHGLGRIEVRDGSLKKKTEKEIYIYVELDNCKTEKRERYYHTNLTLGLSLYYEDGKCIYSKDEVNTFDYQSVSNSSRGYVWVKVETAFLKEGAYKAEMTIRDENSSKEAFALARFTVL